MAKTTYTPRPRLRAGDTEFEGVAVRVNIEKQYAFVSSQMGDVYCPFRSVRTIAADGSRSLKNGDYVSFRIADPEPPRGPFAMCVKVVSPK
jgi:cold shock CspA family protein